MKRRIRALKAIILVFIMVVELFGVDSLCVLAAEITVKYGENVVINDSSADDYDVRGTLTIGNGVEMTGKIYGSGGTVINNGTVNELGSFNPGTVTNNASGKIISVSSNYQGTITNEGTIDSLTMSSYCKLIMIGGSIGTISSDYATPEIVIGNGTTEGNVEVGSISGEYRISGTGTMQVTGSLNLACVNSSLSNIKILVSDDTLITVPDGSTVPVTYGEYTYTLTSGSGQTLSALVGKKISASLESEATMETKTSFATNNYLPGQTATATYKASDGYYFPTGYSATENGAGTVEVSRDDAQNITVTYTFGEETSDVVVTLPAASVKESQETPTGLVGGIKEVSGVTTDMEYATSESATTWTPAKELTQIQDSGTGTLKLEKGTWYFRYKGSDDKLASDAVSVKVKGEGSGTVTVADVNYGGTVAPIAQSDTNDITTAKFEYKKLEQEDSSYSETVPTEIGTYTVRVTFAENENYSGATATANFDIKYLAVPSPAYTLTGTEGENGYFQSAVTVVPATGYTLSTSIDGTYQDTLMVSASQGEKTIYLKNSFGEIGKVTLEAIKIDKDAPVVNVKDGETYAVLKQSFRVDDDNLSKVTINGVNQTVSGKFFTKDLEEKAEAYVIEATDIAGNTTSVSIHVLRDAKPAPTGLVGGVEEVSGVTTDMEYAASETAATWTAVTSVPASGAIKMKKGTWCFRYKETDDTQASVAAFVKVKGKGSGTVTVADVNYGGKVSPKAESTTNDVSKATFLYKEASKDDSAYSETNPTAIGTYTVKAIFAENEDYGGATATADFQIKYLEAPSTPYTLEGTKGENGYFKSEVTVVPATGYQVSTSLGETYNSTIKVSVSQDESIIYLKNAAGEMTDAVILKAIAIDADVPVLNVEDKKEYPVKSQTLRVTDDNLSRVIINGTEETVNGKTFTKELSESEDAYVIEATDEAGNSVKVTISVSRPSQKAPTGLVGGIEEVSGVTTAMEYADSETADVWTAVTEFTQVDDTQTGTIKLEKGIWYFRYKETDEQKAGASVAVEVQEKERETGKGSVEVKDIYYGMKPDVMLSSDTNDAALAVLEYKMADAEDSTYTKTVPTKVGNYVVCATFPQNDEYKELKVTAKFRIQYLPAPEKEYTLEGTKGQNDYYTSNVIITPAQGYLIADKLDGTYKETLVLKDGTKLRSVYLKEKETGAKTDGVNLDEIKIKTEPPKMNLKDGEIYYEDSLSLVIEDMCLYQVLINGKQQELTGNQFSTSLKSNNGKKSYEIVAEDEAGNKNSIVVYVAATWTKTGKIPKGESVNLEAGKGYTLGSGSWQVAGDATSYSGNITVFVKSNGTYTFENR